MWKGLNLDTSQNDGYRQFRFNRPLAHIASQVVNGASHGHASLRCADPEDSMATFGSKEANILSVMDIIDMFQ